MAVRLALLKTAAAAQRRQARNRVCQPAIQLPIEGHADDSFRAGHGTYAGAALWAGPRDDDAGAEVWIEGERVGVAPVEATAVTIGTREVVVKDAAFGERKQSVEVKNGETTELTVMLRPGAPAAAPRLAPLSQ
jgi:hypothetical protein